MRKKQFDIREIGIHPKGKVIANLDVGGLVTCAVKSEEGKLSRTGTLVIRTREDHPKYGHGRHTGRSPQDRYIVDHPEIHDHIDWQVVDAKSKKPINHPIKPDVALRLYKQITKYLSGQPVLYLQHRLVCADRMYGFPLYFVTESPTYALFANNVFRDLPATTKEIPNKPIHVLFAPGFRLRDPQKYGLNSNGFAIIDCSSQKIFIGGLRYCGEAKKAVFTLLNYLLPFMDVFPMHCGANKGEDGDVALFFGLSGTGKTSLSADPHRKLIGDDEHGWSPYGVFNFEGGCYAKLINLDRVKERDIWSAVRKFGALAENVGMQDGVLDLADASITENTRAAYPCKYIENVSFTGVGEHPKVIFFLTADAFGVLPPISRLTPEQAMYHFLSGYTSKLAGTEVGITEPVPTFSPCFGLPFMPLKLLTYAELLGRRLREHDTSVYLVNTGWTEGPFGKGHRINIMHSREMIAAAIRGELEHAQTERHEDLGLQMITSCSGIPDPLMLRPWKTWTNVAEYRDKSRELAAYFVKNFQKNFPDAPPEIANAGPKLRN
ncbi:MAG: phosphoenolpyruvate carboxykinase (ATP) [Deltaproteobacteria bacterium]|nr:phosphoenolpyruvate carboxykinase (ATP) [Deltaproteobacteria bacterium]MBW2075022.1 phosphoenolpyruvate carboxykinase (ATP) [Deltaproteobacteria bacterium]